MQEEIGLSHELKPALGNIGGGDEFDHEDLYTKYKVSDSRVLKSKEKNSPVKQLEYIIMVCLLGCMLSN